MKVVIQRVSSASVKVSNSLVSDIKQGALLLVCFEKDDEDIDLDRVAQKIFSLRYFTDPDTGKMNKSIDQVKGEFLCVSQFTLSWDGKKGNRPSFDNSMEPKLAQSLYLNFCKKLNELNSVKEGVFGANMEISLVNDGPVTFSLTF